MQQRAKSPQNGGAGKLQAVFAAVAFGNILGSMPPETSQQALDYRSPRLMPVVALTLSVSNNLHRAAHL